jgi:hypothetical protein
MEPVGLGLLVTIIALSAIAEVRHLLERRALRRDGQANGGTFRFRARSASRRKPTGDGSGRDARLKAHRSAAALNTPTPDSRDAELAPAARSNHSEPVFAATPHWDKASATQTESTEPAVEPDPAGLPHGSYGPKASSTGTLISAEDPLSHESDGATAAPRASDPPTHPVSWADLEPAHSPRPRPGSGCVDAQPTRQFPVELQEQVARHAGGWVYEIDTAFRRNGPVPVKHVIGAWRINDDGSPSDEFVANPRYSPPREKDVIRARRRGVLGRAKRIRNQLGGTSPRHKPPSR